MMHRHLILLVAFFSHCSRGRVIRPLNHCECGLTKDLEEGTITRIVGGQLANVNEFPWIVGLYTHYRCRGLPVCGGALVSSQHILTAAHCVQPGTIKCAQLGDHDVSKSSETNSTSRTLITSNLQWSIHSDYFAGDEKRLPDHDIAILVMTEPIDFKKWPNIRPICLPDPNRYADVQAGVEATVAGWGLVGDNEGQSLILKKATLYTVTNEQCAKAYGPTLGETLQANQLCAYRNGADACQGDSGGPLFSARPFYLRRDNWTRMEVIGITSYGQKCGLSGIPGGYTRVNHYIKWIMRKMTDTSKVVDVCNGTFGTWILWLINDSN